MTMESASEVDQLKSTIVAMRTEAEESAHRHAAELRQLRLASRDEVMQLQETVHQLRRELEKQNAR